MTENPNYVREDHCPGCGHYIDSASDALDPTAHPAPGDLSVCVYCGVALEFNPVLRLQFVNEYTLSGPEKAYLAHLRLAMKAVGPPPSARQSHN